MNNPSRQTVTRLVSVFTVWGLITLLSACAVFTNDQGKQRAQSLATHFQDHDISPLGPTLQT